MGEGGKGVGSSGVGLSLRWPQQHPQLVQALIQGRSACPYHTSCHPGDHPAPLGCWSATLLADCLSPGPGCRSAAASPHAAPPDI